jgi:hypothetical protein
MRGSNPRPLAHKTNTLPTELKEHDDYDLRLATAHKKISTPGFEPGSYG